MPLKPIRKYDGPEIVAGNIFDFVIDRNGNDEYALRINRYFKTKAYLKQMAEPDAMGYSLYQNVDSIQNTNPYTETSDGLRRQIDAEMGFYDIPKDRVELLEAWGDFEINGETYHNHVLVVANRTTVLRFEPNPYSHGRIRGRCSFSSLTRLKFMATESLNRLWVYRMLSTSALIRLSKAMR